MKRPAPTDIVGSLAWIMDQMEELRVAAAERRISILEAERRLGYNPRYFNGKPWRIPGFGLSGTMHTFADWCAWVERPEAERRAEWDAMSVKDRGKARGAA